MKKFFAEILFVGIAVAAISYYFDGIKNPGFANFISRIKPDYEIANFGTSHGYDFNYHVSPLRGINLNRDGNTLFYDLQNYYYMKENKLLADNAIIVLPISYFIFGLDENRSDRGLENAFVDDYYFYMNRDQIHEYSVKKEVALHSHNAQRNFKSKYKIPQNFKRAPTKNKNVAQNKKRKISQKEKLAKHAEDRTKRHFELARLMPPEKNFMYLEELILDAKESGFNPILVKVPYYEAYNQGFDSDWLKKQYFERLNRFGNKLGVPYLDYSHDERFTKNEGLFKDSDHLNEAGKETFSELVLEDINVRLSEN